MTDLTAYRDHLMAVARDFAGSVESRPHVVGLVLYGSLALGDLTPFSDVDLFAVYDGGDRPKHWVEHRVVDGTKVDLIGVEMSALEGLLVHVPSHLWRGHGVSSYVLKSLLLGAPETILFDPTGRVAEIKSALGRLTSYERIFRPAFSEVFHDMVRDPLAGAEKSLAAGEFDSALRQARWAGETFGRLANDLIPTKSLRTAAEKLGLPELVTLTDRMNAVSGAEPAQVERVWAAANAFWNHCVERGYRPIEAQLRAAGIDAPAKLELIGDYPLFWMGHRLNELGRVIAEFDLTLRWVRRALDRGDAAEAMDVFWPFQSSADQMRRWRGIDEALRGAGHDCSAIVEALASDPETVSLGEALDQSWQPVRNAAPSRETAAETIEIARALKELLAANVPILSADEVSRANVAGAQSTAELAGALSRFERTSAEAGEIDAFREFADERRREIRSPGEDASLFALLPLDGWYLRPEVVPEPAGTSRVAGPDDAWIWRDPKGGAAHRFLPGGELELSVPAYCQMHGERATAPSMTLEVSGDFVVRTRVKGPGGLLVMEPDGSFFDFVRHPEYHEEMRLEATFREEAGARGEIIGRGTLTGEAFHLQVSRRGDAFSARCSADAVQWFRCGDLHLALEDPVQVGFVVLHSRWGGEPEAATFEPLRIWSPG